MGPPSEIFAGIDVAFAKRKLLPVSVCRWIDDRFVPLPLRKAKLTPPRGHGNAAILEDGIVSSFADATVNYLKAIEEEFGVGISRIAIDASSDPKEHARSRRRAEQALDARQIRCITTPSSIEFEGLNKRRLRIWLQAVWNLTSPTPINCGCLLALRFLTG